METEDATIDRLLPMVRRAEDSADDAVSPAGAVGRYQIMPRTARSLGRDPAQLKNADYNEQVARAAIRDLIKQHGQDDKAVLAGYNASPAAVNRWKRAGRNDLVLPRETQNYLKRAGYKDAQPIAYTPTPVHGPEGKKQYQRLLDGGFTKAEADAWAQSTATELRDGGFSEKEVSEYFDDAPYDTKPIEALVQKQIAAVPKEEHAKVAETWQESLQAGLQSSVIGLSVRQKLPDIQQPENATLGEKIAEQGGQMIGDLPAMIAGGALGLPFGGVGIFGGSAALPEAVRGALVDSYKNPNGHRTWRDWAESYAQIAWNTAKAGITGAIAGKVGGAASNVVEGTVAKSTAFAVTAAPTGTVVGSALEGHVPNADDFVAGAALMMGVGLAGHVVGAASRFVPSKATEAIAENLQDLYADTGIHPAEAARAAQNDAALQVELLSRNPDGTQKLLGFQEIRPDEPEITREEAAARMAGMARGAKADGSLDAAKIASDADVAAYKEMEERKAAGLTPVKPLGREPDPATAPISDEQALAIRLGQVGEPEPKMMEPSEGGKGHGGGVPPEEPIEGEFREVPPPKQIGEKMPLGTAESIVDSFIGEKPDKPRPWWNPVTMYRQFVTELAQARVIDKELSSDPKKMGVEDMFRQVYGSRGRTGYFVRYGTVKLGREANGDIKYIESGGPSMFAAFEKARELGGTEDGMVRYTVSVRGLTLDARGITSGLNSAAARRVVEETGHIYHPALKLLQENNHAVVDYVRDSGVLSAVRTAAMKTLNPFHIVFQRVVNPSYNPGGRGFGPKQPVATIKGSTRQIIPPIPAQVDNMHYMIAMADRNLAVGYVLAAYRKIASLLGVDSPLQLTERLDPAKLIEDYNNMPRVNRMDEAGNEIGAADTEALVAFLAQKAFFARRGPNDFLYFNEGVPEIYTARDAETAELMRASHVMGEANILSKIAESFARVARLGITATPAFPLKVALRSQVEAALRSEHFGVPGHVWVSGFWDAVGQGERFGRFMKDGGFGATAIEIDERYLRRDVAAVFEKTGMWDHVRNTMRHPIDALYAYSQIMENSGRGGYWARLIGKGYSGAKAAMISRKSFGDSSEKAGLSWVNTWARTTLFMRPSVMDITYLAQAVRDHPTQTFLKGLALISTMTVAGFIINKWYDADKEDNAQYRIDHPEYLPYSEQPRWLKDMSQVLPPIMGVRLNMPMVPYTGGFLFHTLTERTLQHFYDEDPHAFREWGKTFMNQFMFPVAPALGLPLFEMGTNTKQGSGSPVIPASVEKASADMMYTRYTSELAKGLSRLLGTVGAEVAPITLENFTHDWLGPIPSQAIRLMDGTMKADNRPWQLADIPILGAFVARHPDMGAQPIEDFYAQMKIFEAKHRDIALAIRNQDFSALARNAQDPQGLMKMTQLTRTAQALGIASQMVRTMDTSKMTNAEKQQKMDRIYSQMILQARAALALLDSVPDSFK